MMPKKVSSRWTRMSSLMSQERLTSMMSSLVMMLLEKKELMVKKVSKRKTIMMIPWTTWLQTLLTNVTLPFVYIYPPPAFSN